MLSQRGHIKRFDVIAVIILWDWTVFVLSLLTLESMKLDSDWVCLRTPWDARWDGQMFNILNLFGP
jgi:hypothetical protein